MSGFLPAGGGYRNLLAYQLAEAVHDLTVIFTRRFLSPKDRTTDQMVQAARSGKQNIAEGSAASSTSKETEIKLTNVAKASLEELLLDYEDFLRQNNLQQWTLSHPRIKRMRDYIKSAEFKDSPTVNANRLNAEEYCNLCITLINQTTYLLRKLLERQQEQFLKNGGIREAMYHARVNYRNNPSNPSDKSDKSDLSNPSNQ